MHEYGFTKEDIQEMTPSQVGIFLEMTGCRKNPQLLKTYKDLRFNSEFEFEQYLLQNMRFKK